MKLKVTEAQVKKAITEYLTLQQNMGKLLFLRLNSGQRLVDYGDHKHLIQMCPAGTADFVVFQRNVKQHTFDTLPIAGVIVESCRVTFLEIKSSTGKQSPDQVAFAQKAMRQNCRYYIVRDAGQLEEIFK